MVDREALIARSSILIQHLRQQMDTIREAADMLEEDRRRIAELKHGLNSASETVVERERHGWTVHAGITCVECPTCGFTFDADHEDDTPEGGYSCPLCVSPRHGPGPNGEWGRWEQLPDRNQFGNLQHHYLCTVYRFVPFDADDPDPARPAKEPDYSWFEGKVNTELADKLGALIRKERKAADDPQGEPE